MSFIKTLAERVECLTRYAIVAMLLAISVIMLVEVLIRHFLDASIAWSYELSRILLVWMVLLGSINLLIRGEHIRIDAPFSRHKALRFIVKWISSITYLSLGIISLSLVDIVMEFDQSSATLGTPIWIYYLVTPVSFLLMGFYAISRRSKGE